MRMRRHFPGHFDFAPLTWILPHDWSDVAAWMGREQHAGRTPTLILKPANGAQGAGISLAILRPRCGGGGASRLPQAQRLEAVREELDEAEPGTRFVCQQYIARPLTVEGFKLDLRMYVLVSSVVPFRIYLYDEGLLRFATEKYRRPRADNLEAVHQHLTNYHLNRDSEGYAPSGGDGSTGSKRRLTWLWEWLEAERGASPQPIIDEIGGIVVKTVLSAAETLQHSYRSSARRWQYRQSSACFQLLGFDLMLDRDLRPWLIEVNHSPSFSCGTELDRIVKDGAIREALALVDIFGPDPQACRERERLELNERLLVGKGAAGREARRADARRRAQQAGKARAAAIERLERSAAGGEGPKYRRIYPPPDGSGAAALAAQYEHFLAAAPAVNSATVASKGHSAAAQATIAKLRAAELDKQRRPSRRQAAPPAERKPALRAERKPAPPSPVRPPADPTGAAAALPQPEDELITAARRRLAAVEHQIAAASAAPAAPVIEDRIRRPAPNATAKRRAAAALAELLVRKT